jgi:hypothetical protein
MLMKNHESKITLPESGRKLLVVAGAVVLLIGLAILRDKSAQNTYAPIVILLGLFWMCLGTIAGKEAATSG